MEKFEIKTTLFLRYKHVAKIIDEHDIKFIYFLKKFHPESEPSLQISHKSIPLTFQGKAFLPKQILYLLDVKHAERDIYTRDLNNPKTEDNASKPLIIVKGMRNGRQKVSLQTRDTNVMESVKFECSADEFISKVDLLLEQFALNQFKTKIEQVHKIREEIANNDISGWQTSKKRKLSIDQTTLRSGKSFHPSTESAHGGEFTVLDEMEREVLTDTIRSGEALFRRRANTTEAQEKSPVLTDEVSNGIFSTDQRIHGCGYRRRILNIFVDEQDVEEQLQIAKRIETTLRTYNIVDFEVLFGLYKIQLLSGHVAGCEIENEFGFSGTLGGYTRNERRKDQKYGLSARHFAEPDMDAPLEAHVSVYCRGRNNSKTKIGEVVRCRGRGEYDISAVKMIVDSRDTRLRNSAGEHMRSRLFLFDEENQEERPVYIWTKRETNPRKGIIAIPYYKRRALEGHYVLIEDTSELDSETNTFRWKRLCESGQSGAIFCSDEPDGTCAHAICMLEGMQNYQEVDADPNKKGLYLSFGLYKGLEQLKTEIGEQLELC